MIPLMHSFLRNSSLSFAVSGTVMERSLLYVETLMS